jgi:hypothetical protein
MAHVEFTVPPSPVRNHKGRLQNQTFSVDPPLYWISQLVNIQNITYNLVSIYVYIDIRKYIYICVYKNMWHTHNHMCLCSQVWRGFFFGGKKYHHELYKEIATRPIMAKISLQKQHLFPSFHVHEFVLWELGFILIKHSKKSRDRST